MANVYQAIDNNHEIVVVLNKIDLPAAEPERIREQIEEVIGIDATQAVLISAKSGIGIADVLEAIVHQLPPPREGDAAKPLKALLVDCLVRRLSRRHRSGARYRRRPEEGPDHPHDGAPAPNIRSSAPALHARR